MGISVIRLVAPPPPPVVQFPDTDWVDATPLLVNQWKIYDAAGNFEPPAYRRRNGRVYMQGFLTVPSITNGYQILGPLPAGFRPNVEKYIPCVAWNGWANVSVGADGVIYYHSGDTRWFSIQSVSWEVYQ